MEVPTDPAEGIGEWGDLASFEAVSDLDGDEADGELGVGEGEEHFGFYFEMKGGEAAMEEGREVGEAVAALGIGEVGMCGAGEALAEPAVGPAAERRHGAGMIHAIADDETGIW
jgi:hypothetical protein